MSIINWNEVRSIIPFLSQHTPTDKQLYCLEFANNSEIMQIIDVPAIDNSGETVFYSGMTIPQAIEYSLNTANTFSLDSNLQNIYNNNIKKCLAYTAFDAYISINNFSDTQTGFRTYTEDYSQSIETYSHLVKTNRQMMENSKMVLRNVINIYQSINADLKEEGMVVGKGSGVFFTQIKRTKFCNT